MKALLPLGTFKYDGCMSENRNMISDEAVEAGAWALDPQTMGSGGRLAEKFQAHAREEARRILEAAAPYMQGEAWEEGYTRGFMDCSNKQESIRPNPYRSQA